MLSTSFKTVHTIVVIGTTSTSVTFSTTRFGLTATPISAVVDYLQVRKSFMK